MPHVGVFSCTSRGQARDVGPLVVGQMRECAACAACLFVAVCMRVVLWLPFVWERVRTVWVCWLSDSVEGWHAVIRS